MVVLYSTINVEANLYQSTYRPLQLTD